MGILIQIPKVTSHSNPGISDGNKPGFGGKSLLDQKKASSSSAGATNSGSSNGCKNERPPLIPPANSARAAVTSNLEQTITTPSLKQEQSNYYTQPQHIPLSITCKVCGTEGPEGSSRAYVSGPSPLSITLCS